MNRPSPTVPTPNSSNAALCPETTSWRYVAIDRHRSGAQRHGQMAGVSAADVRASLRRIGLQPLEVTAARSSCSPTKPRVTEGFFAGIRTDFEHWWHRRCRASRALQRAELYDGLATMLGSGMPLSEAVQTLIDAQTEKQQRSKRRAMRGKRASMLFELHDRLRGGDSLARALRDRLDWFDAVDIAMIEAGQHGGTLPSVLASLAQRQERSSELMNRVGGALAYPLLVTIIGLGVVMFLSVKTLPDLTKILSDAGIPIPTLTAKVMWLGQSLARHWLNMAVISAALVVMVILAPRTLTRLNLGPQRALGGVAKSIWPPRFMRQLLVGRLVGRGGLADLLRSGVPMVEAIRVLAPTQPSKHLRMLLIHAVGCIERGDDLAHALVAETTARGNAEDEGIVGSGGPRGGRHWFDAELRRLLEIGQASGELEAMLERIGERYERRAKRLIDRFTSVLEPAVLLLLAILVGTVVMAAVLPLLALQDILR